MGAALPSFVGVLFFSFFFLTMCEVLLKSEKNERKTIMVDFSRVLQLLDAKKQREYHHQSFESKD